MLVCNRLRSKLDNKKDSDLLTFVTFLQGFGADFFLSTGTAPVPRHQKIILSDTRRPSQMRENVKEID